MRFSKPTKSEMVTIKSIAKEFGLTAKLGRNKRSTADMGKQCKRLSKDVANRIVAKMNEAGFILDPYSCIEESIENGVADILCFYAKR